MLRALAASPSSYREVRATLIGRCLAICCFVGGWLAPMFGAGKLESGNIPEYERAAQLARACGKHQFVDCLLSMAGNGMGPRKVFSFDGPEPSLGLSIANMARTTAEREHSVAF